MLQMFLFTFIVLLLSNFPVLTTGASQEERITFYSKSLSSTPTALVPLPIPETPGVQAPSILSPLPGQALQGNIPIMANTSVQGFISSELSFSYMDNPTGVWFLIHHSNQPIMYQTLAHWDTTTITDGEYDLRLVIHLSDGSQETLTVPGVRVRNYSIIETNTPSPLSLTETWTYGQELVTTQSPGDSLIPATVTPFPINPAEISRSEVFDGILLGALLTLVIFALGILYRTIRSFLRKRVNL